VAAVAAVETKPDLDKSEQEVSTLQKHHYRL
jgi:hypothetical protein